MRRLRVGALAAPLLVFVLLMPHAAAGATTGVAASPGPKVIVEGVTIGGILVGGLTVPEAKMLVSEYFRRPLVLRGSSGQKYVFTPYQLGAVANVKKAVGIAARVRRPGFTVPLDVAVPRGRLERHLARLGKELNRAPVDARMKLKGLEPVVSKHKPGRRLKEVIAAREVRRALKTHSRQPVRLRFDVVKPGFTVADFRSLIVIRRESKKLHFYAGGKLKRVFGVATGQSSYPTPIGRFEVVTKQRDPWWYPPAGSDWAEGKEPVPPGPGNPLGTRWMGISAPYIGIHGTPDAASIGYSASHGCVRMLVPQAEWLFERIEVGTPVYILRA